MGAGVVLLPSAGPGWNPSRREKIGGGRAVSRKAEGGRASQELAAVATNEGAWCSEALRLWLSLWSPRG